MSTEPSSSKRWRNRIIYVLVLLVFQELIFRFFFPLPELQNFDRVNYLNLGKSKGAENYWRDNDRYWESTPDTSFQFVHELNRYGFRGEEWPVEKPVGKKRVLFIGDSFVEGAMANQGQAIPDIFASAAGEKYEVLNGGMMGMGLTAYLQFAADAVPTFKPDIVVVCLYANDLGQEAPKVPQMYLEPETYSTFTPRLLEVFAQWNKNGAIKFRWNGSTRPFLPGKDSDGNPWNTDGELFKPHVEASLAEQMRNGTFNPFRTNNLLGDEKFLKQKPGLGETVPFLKYTCDQSGAQLIICYIPNRNQVTKHYYPYEFKLCQLDCNESFDLTQPQYHVHQQIIAKQCRDFGASFIDLTPTVREAEVSGNHIYWNYDDHMRASGYKLVGNTIWQQLRN